MHNSSRLLGCVAWSVFALTAASCADQVRYGDASTVETVNADFGSTDLQMMSAKMVDSLLTFPPVVQITQYRRPIVFVDSIRNKTNEHIDTESLTDTISTRLLRSGRFQFVDRTRVDAIQTELDYQHRSGMVDPTRTVALGRQVGAEFMLAGNLSSIDKRAGSTRDVYMKLTLSLINLRTGLLEWQDEKEIRKTQKSSLLGW